MRAAASASDGRWPAHSLDVAAPGTTAPRARPAPRAHPLTLLAACCCWRWLLARTTVGRLLGSAGRHEADGRLELATDTELRAARAMAAGMAGV